MTNETLSDKIEDNMVEPINGTWLYAEDVKEAVKKLNEGIPMSTTQAGIKTKDYWRGVNDMIKRMNEIFGEELVKEDE